MQRCFIFLLLITIVALAGGREGMAQTPSKRSNWPPEKFLVYYGPWGSREIEQAHPFDLIIVHPGKDCSNITPELIKTLKNRAEGKGDRLILAYVSIGEDEEVPRGPAPKGEEIRGPVYFDPVSKELNYMKRDYPTRYVDEIRYALNEQGFFDYLPTGMPRMEKGHDGIPDENGVWSSFYVNAGDTRWQAYLNEHMNTLSTVYGVDGFFLDTLDTASPWGNYGWMQQEMALLVKKIRTWYPEHILIANRGLFLFDGYADLFRPSIDGLLFESFATEWNWQLKKGFQSPYLKSNYDILKQKIEPEAAKEDGFHLFVLDYLSTTQHDFYPLLAVQKALLGTMHCSSSISTPDLQSIYPPLSTYFTQPAEAQVPGLANFTAREEKPGTCTVTFSFSRKTLGEQLPWRDFFLDVRAAAGAITPEQMAFLDPLPIDYRLMKSTTRGDYLNLSFTFPGFNRGTRYWFYGRVIGRDPVFQPTIGQAQITTADGPYPDPVRSLAAEGMESSGRLTWETNDNRAAAYRIYLGTEREKLSYIKTVNEKMALVEGLTNGTPYYLSVTALSPGGDESSPSLPVIGIPRPTLPPPPPLHVKAQSVDGNLAVTWEKPESNDLQSFHVYCCPVGEGLRLPLVTSSSQSTMTVSDIKAGVKYRVFVTSVDSHKNESRPSTEIIISIPQ